MLIDQSAEHQLLAGTSREVSETICFSKDTSKTVSPTGSWETQTYTHHKDWLLCPIFWLGMWLVAKYHAPGWEEMVDFPDVVSGKAKGWGLQPVFCYAKTVL